MMKINIHPLRVTKLKKGDVFSAKVEIENQDINPEVLSALEARELFGGLILNNVTQGDDGSVTADIFIVNDQLENHDSLSIGKNNLEASLVINHIDTFATEAKELVVLNQSTSSLNWPLLLGALIVLVVIGYVKRKSISNLFINKSKKEQARKRKDFFELLINANNRKAFEEIYLSYGQWSSLISHDENLWEDYKKVLNMYQFQPVLENWQVAEIQKAYSAFKGSLK